MEEQEQSVRLEDLLANAAARGVPADGLVTVVGDQWFGSETLEPTYKTPAGKVANELLKLDGTPPFPERTAYTVPYRLPDAEARLYKAEARRPELFARAEPPR